MLTASAVDVSGFFCIAAELSKLTISGVFSLDFAARLEGVARGFYLQSCLLIAANISRTARSIPTNAARATILWPMFNSSIG